MAACLASRTGDTKGMLMIDTPSRIRNVCAAAKASEASGSSTLRYTDAGSSSAATSSRWKAHTES